jgi:elongator complex protein 2
MDGACLLTVGEDQTARIFTSVLPDDGDAVQQDDTSVEREGHWCELARPQVHGHDFTCVTSLPQMHSSPAAEGVHTPTSYVFISG